jgi:Ca2+-binding EF-hand superfamily protein
MRAAVADPTKQADRIDMEGLRQVFANIGALDRIADDEIALIFKELGNDVGEIDIPRFKKLVCP